jgi:hypothetical protein
MGKLAILPTLSKMRKNFWHGVNDLKTNPKFYPNRNCHSRRTFFLGKYDMGLEGNLADKIYLQAAIDYYKDRS